MPKKREENRIQTELTRTREKLAEIQRGKRVGLDPRNGCRRKLKVHEGKKNTVLKREVLLRKSREKD